MYRLPFLIGIFLGTTMLVVHGNPTPQVIGIESLQPNTCPGETEYVNDKTEEPYTDPPLTGSLGCDASGTGCTNMLEKSFDKGREVTVGMEAGITIADIINAGVSTSLTNTETSGTAEGVSKDCPPGEWWCALYVVTGGKIVTGVRNVPGRLDDNNCGFIKTPYKAKFPIKVGNIPGSGIDNCVCTNACGWALPGAPSRLCPQPCTGVVGGPGDECPKG